MRDRNLGWFFKALHHSSAELKGPKEHKGKLQVHYVKLDEWKSLAAPPSAVELSESTRGGRLFCGLHLTWALVLVQMISRIQGLFGIAYFHHSIGFKTLCTFHVVLSAPTHFILWHSHDMSLEFLSEEPVLLCHLWACACFLCSSHKFGLRSALRNLHFFFLLTIHKRTLNFPPKTRTSS